MDIGGKTIWQQAAGDTNRKYTDLCLQWSVILNGPGVYGRWPECQSSLRRNGIKEKKITDLRRFCEEMEDGHLVVLRLGTSFVFGVGQILGPYDHCEEFNDIDGWDVAHVRRVRWLWKNVHNPKRFDTYTLKQGDTTQPLTAPAVETWLETLEISEAVREEELAELPSIGAGANPNFEDISEYLFDKGVASDSISNLLDQMGEFVRIANWYKRSQNRPSEHETISYLVVPLLRALGWTPQRMAIEWNRIDVALFSGLPRGNNNLSVVVEVKKMRDSCLSGFPQANYYADNLNAEHCRRLIVTDGLRYGIFTRQKDEEFSLSAYMNLTRLRSEYPIYKCKGVQETLLSMSPEWQ